MGYGLLFKEWRPSLLVIPLNAPGRSAFNPVERAMAPLNRPLNGVVLSNDLFGDHIIHGKVPQENKELEKKMLMSR